MLRITLILLWSSLSISAFGQNAYHLDRYDTLRGLNSQLRQKYDVHYYDLHLTILPEQRYIEGYNAIHLQALKDIDTLQIDLFDNFIIDSLTFNDNPIRYRTDSNTIYVIFDEYHLYKSEKGILKVYYKGFPHTAKKAPWDGGMVWSKDDKNRSWSGVACEGIGASLWWPCKDYLGDEPDSVDLHFTVPDPYTCVANGRYVGKETHQELNTYHWKVSYPINTYNITFYIGLYELIEDEYISGQDTLQLSYYVLKDHVQKAKEHFEQVKPMLKTFEKTFGPYPFWRDGYKVIESPYIGMEHQEAIAYGDDFQNTRFGFDFILVHESGHEYWGNSISCEDIGELWIHEAFTTYMESILVEDWYGKDSMITYLNHQKDIIENIEPMMGPLEVNYHHYQSNDIYYKGALMLHTLRNAINDDIKWNKLLYDLYQEHQYSTVNSQQIISTIQSHTNFDVVPFFQHYLYQLKYPLLDINITQLKKKQWKVTASWQHVEQGFSLPVWIYLDGVPHSINLKTSEFQKIFKHTEEVYYSKNLNIFDVEYQIKYK